MDFINLFKKCEIQKSYFCNRQISSGQNGEYDPNNQYKAKEMEGARIYAIHRFN